MFKSLFLIYNLHACLVGMNQIRNVYIPNFDRHDPDKEFVPGNT